MNMQQQQLTFDVELHPSLAAVEHPYMTSSLKVGLDVGIPGDLQPGEIVMVTVHDQDGQLLSRREAEVGSVGFVMIKDAGSVIGTERQHKAKLKP